ncbi:amphi-Trp domain-containing protein [Halobacterium litoreum]|uniref:Amphi-Trp domain-containing protein n=1 Tax=Halobacterium litoreum TaxID=2039234 RepID=A0ABD5ND62_9EURY|nr:amphi-Trp domain-containing protein [Halobacterium litoreum]UHH14213.1 amphi-Trp domain-containing protein [Halobacterium litoreum]
MPEEVIFESESTQSRSDVANYLRTVADKLDAGGDLTLSAGDQSVTLDPPTNVAFEVKAERETGSGADELSVEFELEWADGEDAASGDLDIA